jgi:hypothetical protein
MVGKNMGLPSLTPKDVADAVIYALSTPPTVNVSSIHTFLSRFPEGVAETCQIAILYQNYLAMRNTAEVKASKPIAV